MKLLHVFACLLMAYVRESLAECDGVSLHTEVATFLREAKAAPNPNYQITYDLYTRQNMNKRQILRTGDRETLKNSNFETDLPLRVFINGWTGRSTACSGLMIKDAYLSSGDFNVILVDWSAAALNTDSLWVENQFPKVAGEIAQFIKFLQSETAGLLNGIYLIGHNTGCHITGIVGKLLKSKNIDAIIALDPTGLTQPGLTSDYHLAPNQARYVQSIHTDISVMRRNGKRISHAAFFPNWGQQQPQCREAGKDLECNQFAAVQYFAQSIRQPKLFGAIRCPNLSSITKYYNCECSSGQQACEAAAYMGGEPLKAASGYFYLSTGSSPPYGFNDTTVHVLPVKL